MGSWTPRGSHSQTFPSLKRSDSHDNQVPHGVAVPPEFEWLHAKIGWAPITEPVLSKCIEEAPPHVSSGVRKLLTSLFEAKNQPLFPSGIVPAPEATHAVKGAIDAALECKEKGESKTILFNLCGHAHFDMSAYDDYLNGSMADDVIDDEGINKSISQIPEVA